jgi:DNA-directed RNA polymerase specialized sigma subunit
MGQSIDKETLQALREERKRFIERARKSIKENNKVLKAIREQIAAQPKTVPEIAQALAMDTAEVLLLVSALKKYGEVMEGPKDGDYFRYGLVP